MTTLASAVLLTLTLVLPAPQNSAAEWTLDDLSWLAGSWQTDGGRTRFQEHWTDPAGGTMLGVGRTLQNERTMGFEYLRIEIRDNGIYYVAQPNGGPPTDFRLVHLDAETAVFENPDHDFPKQIRYVRGGDGRLTARVSGDPDQGSTTFEFSRLP